MEPFFRIPFQFILFSTPTFASLFFFTDENHKPVSQSVESRFFAEWNLSVLSQRALLLLSVAPLRVLPTLALRRQD